MFRLPIRRKLNFTNSEVHDELSVLGVSSEVHALVDDLDLVPLVVDERLKRFVINRAHTLTITQSLKQYVHKSDDYVQEVQGRLFEEN